MIKKFFFRKYLFLLLLFIAFTAAGILFSEDPQRYFGATGADLDGIHLTIFHPAIGRIKDLLALKEQGFMDFSKLSVFGVYHTKEKTDYKDAEQFARDRNLDWITFHGISAEVPVADLFKKNAWTAEFETIFKKSDGIIFFGGADIPPYLYGEKTDLLTKIEDPHRHFLETSFIFHLLGGFQDQNFRGLLEDEPGFPILGICLGCQSLNVGTGGTLIQDIWSEIYGKRYVEDVIALGENNWHSNPFDRLYPELKMFPGEMHAIRMEEKGKFCQDMGFQVSDKPYIFSSHHQQVERLGKGLRVIATSLDGKVAEALDHEKYLNVLGVQFHPENCLLWDLETKLLMTPGDKEPVSLKSFLEAHPPSFEFHKKLWAWFSQKIRASRRK